MNVTVEKILTRETPKDRYFVTILGREEEVTDDQFINAERSA